MWRFVISEAPDTVERIRDSYDRLADEYARRLYGELGDKPRDRELLTRFAILVEGRGAVCDLGCGPGQVSRFLRDLGSNVFGVDLSPRMVNEARQLNPDLRFREGNMLALDMEDGELAGIVAFYAIVNLPHEYLPRVFEEMVRVLQPGGLLLLAFHIGDELIRVNELWDRDIAMNFLFFRPAAIARLLEDAGFSIEEVIERQPYAPNVEYQSRRAYMFARKR